MQIQRLVTTRTYMKALTFIVVFSGLWSGVNGQSDALRAKHFNLDDKLALDGYDPVSYFQKAPAEGKNSISYEYKGVLYFFESAANLEKFKASPEVYEPAYGGWCAYAMGDTGEKVKVDPETFKIINGKVYLFYNFWGNNTLKTWNQNELVLKAKADVHWSKAFR